MLDSQRIHAILFDLDGTLSDTDDVYLDRAARVLEKAAFLFPRRDVRTPLRDGMMASEGLAGFLLTVPDRLGLDDELAALTDAFAHARGLGAPGDFRMIPGIRGMLDVLAGQYPLAIVSSRDRRGTEAFLAEFSLRGHFHAVVTALTAPRIKPHPAPVRLAADLLGVPVEHCLMVGDTRVDIQAGRRAGAQTAGVLCGFGRRADLERAGADVIVETTADIPGLITG